MNLVLPEAVKKIISILEENGHEAYAVGGCVRDSILGKIPSDWDITTSALPEEVKSVFHRTIDTGIQHGTVTVRMMGEGYEVTTFRVDGDYRDGRHPSNVTFTASLGEDLARRDFTINAMAYSDKTGIVDLYDGQRDLSEGIIRCVGDPYERFSEDALRMMRAVRFAAQLDFKIDGPSAKAVKELAPDLKKISAERIRDELLKLLVSDHPELMRDMSDLGLTKVFMPEWDRMRECGQNTPHHMYDVGEHTIRVMQGVRADKNMRLAALLHDVGKPVSKTTDEDGRDHFHGHQMTGESIARDILRRLKLDNATTAYVTSLVKWHDIRPEPDKRSVRRVASKMGSDIFPDIFELKRADILGQSDYYREEKLQRLESFEELYEEIVRDNECLKISDLAIGGRDLIDEGMGSGPHIGEILKDLLEIVIEDPQQNQRDILLGMVRERYGK